MTIDGASQSTLACEVVITGQALFSGRPSTVIVMPADVNSGISFVRGDLSGKPIIPASPDEIYDGELSFRCMALGNSEPLVYPIEHLLAALFGLGISNATVLLDGPEIPFFDGSAKHFVEHLLEARIVDQGVSRPALEISNAISINNNGHMISLTPSHDLQISYEMHYVHSAIGHQSFSFSFDREAFISEIAPARTFCTEEESRDFLERGGRGGNAHSALVMGEHGPIDNELRFPDEFARHKVMDLLGDIAILGCNLSARVSAKCSGHRLNAAMVKKLAGLR